MIDRIVTPQDSAVCCDPNMFKSCSFMEEEESAGKSATYAAGALIALNG